MTDRTSHVPAEERCRDKRAPDSLKKGEKGELGSSKNIAERMESAFSVRK